MSIRSNIPQITVLREKVEHRFGKRLAVHADFLALVAEIEMEQRQHISESTLERVWGYSTRGYETVSLRTLDVLAHYIDYHDWKEFCQQLHAESECESELFDLDYIASNDLAIGEKILLGWLPDRICEVRYLGNNRFIAEHCENSKLQEGDTFSCLQFVLGQALSLNDLRRNNITIGQTYVIGQKNGLTTLKRTQS